MPTVPYHPHTDKVNLCQHKAPFYLGQARAKPVNNTTIKAGCSSLSACHFSNSVLFFAQHDDPALKVLALQTTKKLHTLLTPLGDHPSLSQSPNTNESLASCQAYIQGQR